MPSHTYGVRPGLTSLDIIALKALHKDDYAAYDREIRRRAGVTVISVDGVDIDAEAD